MTTPGATDLLSAGTPPDATMLAYAAPEAVAARNEIDAIKADKEFFKALQAEGDRGGPAHQKWAELHAKGWPASIAPVSESDVAAQAEARNAREWSTFIGAQPWAVSPQEEAELKGGVIHEEDHKRAVKQLEMLQNDRDFYLRLKAGNVAAKELYARLTLAAKFMRPVR